MAENKQPENVFVAGGGTVWVAPEGTTAPTDLATLTTPWVDVGYIGEDGATIAVARETEGINAWQSADPVRVLVTAEPKTISLELLEFDRTTLELAFRGGTWSGVSAPYTYTPPVAGASDVRAMVIDGVDGADSVRFVFRRVQLGGDVEFGLLRTDATRFPLEFSVLAGNPTWTLLGDLAGFAAGAGMAGTVAAPRTHAELDELAAEHGYAWPEGVSTVAEKQAALVATGTLVVEPEAA